ncbi:MAG: YchJ family protein [Myxococcota bacterium]
MTASACPCGSKKPYPRCCRPIHAGAASERPEQLMRARYSAFVQGEVDFLVRTHRPSDGSAVDREGIERTSRETDWRGLSVLGRGMTGEDRGWVEFAARFRGPDGSRGFLHERSEFVREGGDWFYVGGAPGKPRAPHTLCLCGSGKKTKKCCGRA